MRHLLGTLIGVAVLSSAAPASADPFSSYTSGLTFGSAPTYSFGSTTGAVNLSGSTVLTAQTGAFEGVTAGVASGSLQFSMTPTATISASPMTVLSFSDPAGASAPAITFSLVSVETVGYSASATEGDTIQLYILGNTAGGAGGADGSLSSFVLNLFGFSGSASITSATLSNLPADDPNPPTPSPSPTPSPTPAPIPIPEPATLALLGAGLFGMAALRRYRSRR